MSIEVNQVTKKYSEQLALECVSLNVPSGSVLGLLGPNGAGKSTLMKLICGYIPPNEGALMFADLTLMRSRWRLRRG